jgi:hypothetical protein
MTDLTSNNANRWGANLDFKLAPEPFKFRNPLLRRSVFDGERMLNAR